MKNFFNLILISFAAVVINSSHLTAQILDDVFSDKTRFGTGPQLDGHDFIVNSFIKNPFINTNIRTSLGYATSIETDIPRLKVDSDTISKKLKGNISYISGLFEFQYAVKDWAAIWLSGSAIARLGTNVPSLFVSGITANTSFETGLMFKVLSYKKMLLSSSFSINNSGSSVISIFPYIVSQLDSTYDNKLLESYNPLSGSVDVRLAYTPGKRWSILGYVESGYGEIIGKDIDDRFFTSFGATANFNLSINSKTPLSFGTGFRLNSNSPTLDDVSQWTQAYLVQIAYCGKRDFLLSIEATYLRIPSRSYDLTLNLTSYGLNWTYYF
ncbi:MAG: hypothetical protein M3R36_11620 [Bacteroidota bacterium]|nr:hypothetical protein [Bacteroidota bacterium]